MGDGAHVSHCERGRYLRHGAQEGDPTWVYFTDELQLAQAIDVHLRIPQALLQPHAGMLHCASDSLLLRPQGARHAALAAWSGREQLQPTHAAPFRSSLRYVCVLWFLIICTATLRDPLAANVGVQNAQSFAHVQAALGSHLLEGIARMDCPLTRVL